MSNMVNYNNGNSARILSILSIKKLFITEATVRGETYVGNVVCLFRPSSETSLRSWVFQQHKYVLMVHVYPIEMKVTHHIDEQPG